jgi:methyl-accepting chemotaxis protein
MNWLNNIGIGRKLAMGFGLISVVMVGIIVMVSSGINSNSTVTNRVIDLRQPTVLASTELLNGVNQSLAGLRGYMVLGKNQFKTERIDGWEKINAAADTMNELSQSWTNPENVARLADVNASLKRFAQAQEEIEAISGTPANNPATQMLVTEAAPKASVMIKSITKMIDIEATLPGTPERKALLGMMADVRGTTGMALANIRAFLLTGDPTFRDTFDTFWAKNERRYADMSDHQQLFNAAQAEAFVAFDQARDGFKGLPPQMFEIRANTGWNLANMWLGTKAAPEAVKIKAWMAKMVADQQALANADTAAAAKSSDNLLTFIYVLGALALALAGFIAWGTSRMITNPLADMLAALEEIADGDGDLTRRLADDRKDELGSVAAAFNRFVEKIHGVVLEVTEAAASISGGTREMALGNEGLSQRTEEQAASLEETAASMEQMTANVRQAADNAAKVNQLSQDTRGQAEHGQKVVADAISAMGEVDTASKKIAEIIGMVGEIAFQTNLLALNASVEAARAGDQGRGFAVVATEVRNLAQRSASAATEIKTLIGDTVDKVEAGAALVSQSGDALEEIVAGINRVSDMVSEIDAASQEQASGIEQVNTAVLQMDEMTQNNAALVEEGQAASEQVAEQSQQLVKIMTFFKVGESDPTVAAPSEVVAPQKAASKPVAPKAMASAPISKPTPKPTPKAVEAPQPVAEPFDGMDALDREMDF